MSVVTLNQVSNSVRVLAYSGRILEAWNQQNPSQVSQWKQKGLLDDFLRRANEKMVAEVARLVVGGTELNEAEREAAEMVAFPTAP